MTNTLAIPMSQERGKDFELVVQAVLTTLAARHRQFVTVQYQPELVLDNERVVVPDFDLHVNLVFEEARYLIECQDRDKYSHAVADKISRIKALSARNRFIFIAGSECSEALERTLKRDGVLTMKLEEFVRYVVRLDEVLGAIRVSDIRSKDMDPKPFVQAVDGWLNGKKSKHPLQEAIRQYQSFDPTHNPQVSGARCPSPREYLSRDEWRYFDAVDGTVYSHVYRHYIEQNQRDAIITTWIPTDPAYDYWYCLLHERRNPRMWIT